VKSLLCNSSHFVFYQKEGEEMSKPLTEEALEHRRAKRREYWEKMPEQERKERRRNAVRKYRAKLSPEERKRKRNEYTLRKAMQEAAATNTDKG
jgi:hypothetical protein